MKLKIDKADKIFSLYIRTRDDWTCQRCKKSFKHKSGGLHCSHYYGRSKESTRFEPDNCDALCFGCHQFWGSTDREGYRSFKLKQLGEKRFKSLMVQANTYQKKDRKWTYLVVKKLYEDLLANNNASKK